MNKIIRLSVILTIFVQTLFANADNIPQQLKKASWIWPYPFWNYDIANSFALFRETVDLQTLPKKAKVFITADQSYMLYVNGELVSKGPARGFQRSWPFDEVDITSHLKKGKNVFAIRAYNPGKSTFGYISEGVAGVLYAFDIDGKLIVSRVGTKCMRQNSCDRDTVSASMQLNGQEHIDMRLEPIGWKDADFDDSKWGISEGSKAYNAMPFYTLEPRGIPMYEFKILPSPKLIAKATGKSGANQQRIRNVFFTLDMEKSIAKKANGTLPLNIEANKADEFSTYTFDFGKIVLGTPIIEVEGANGGEIIDILFDEQINEKFEPYHSYKDHCKTAFGVRAICKKGKFSHEFFNHWAFRYAVVKIRNNSSDIKFNLKLRWTAYPMEQKGVFKTSNELVNKIWQASAHTQRICTIDAYVDTPWREQAQWWGDARVQAWNTFFLANDTRVFERGIRIISMQKVPNGLTYGHAPTMAHHCILPDFSLVWIATLWDHYWQTGSNKMYLQHKDTVEGILKYFESIADENTGLSKYDSRYWLFLDWTTIQKKGQPALLSLWHLYALQRLAVMCKETGLEKDSAMYQAKADKVRSSIEKHLLGSDGLVRDGISPDGKLSTETSIHAQTLARLTGIRGFDFEKAKKEIILPYLRGKIKLKASPSSYWVVYVLKLMIDEGYQKDVFNYIVKRWQPMAETGSTWENFDGTLSRSHAWSAHPTFLLPQILGGIKQKSAGWKDYEAKPNKFVEHAEILYPTPSGDIKVSY